MRVDLRSMWRLLLLLAAVCGTLVQAADPAAAKPKDDLSLQQQQIRRDYERFERSLLEAAEHLRRKEPEQSDILDRAREKSQEQALLGEMEKIAIELKQNQTGSASDRQRLVIERMEEILQLLQSEDERDRLQREMERIQDLIKDANRVIGKQRDAQATNQKGGDQKQAEDEQKKAAEEAKKLANKIDKQDKARKGQSKPSDAKPSESKDSPSGDPKDKPSGEQKPGETKPKDGDKPKPGDEKDKPGADKPKDPKDPKDGMPPSDSTGKPKPGDSPSKPGKPMPGKPMPGKDSPPSQSPPSDQPPMPGSPMPPMPGSPMPPMPGQPPSPMPPQDQPPPDQQTEGRKDLQEAQDSMQKAIEDLEKKSRETAGEEQERALKKLEELKAKLEEILRQRREEEKELYLAMLEVRFQKMLKVQLQVNAETTRLEKIPEKERNPAHFDKCSEAARQQRENYSDAGKTLVLLKEEGSSVAFPEAVEQMQGNMDLIAKRLTRADTGDTTQLLEQLVIETLEEITLALQKEMETQRQKKQQGPTKKPKPGQPEDQGLVNKLAELKMIRSLQNQVNRITKQIGTQIEGEQTGDPDQRKLTEDLGKRQQRIQSATYDLSTGRNK